MPKGRLRKRDSTDHVLNWMLKEGVPLTQQNYLQLNYRDDRTIEDLGPEELADLPEDFKFWPRTESDIH